MKVECEIVRTEIENDQGRESDGVTAECSRCGHCTQSFGQGPASVRRCLALMNSECPNGEDNFYAAENE